MTIDTSFHRAFDINGKPREGFAFDNQNNEITSNCDNLTLLGYICEDNLLSEQDLNKKIKNIPKTWSKITLPEDAKRLDQIFATLEPPDRQTLSVFLKSLEEQGRHTLAPLEKEANFFTICLHTLKKVNPKYVPKLREFLTTDPHKIPLFITLLNANQTELCDYLLELSRKVEKVGLYNNSIVIEVKPDHGGSRKLIQALVDRLGDPNFNLIVSLLKEIINERASSKKQVSLAWLAKLIKHDLLLPMKANSPSLLRSVLNQTSEVSTRVMRILKLYSSHPSFVAKYFIQLKDLVDPALFKAILDRLEKGFLPTKEAEYLIQFDPILLAHMELLLKSNGTGNEYYLTILEIFKDHPEELKTILIDDPKVTPLSDIKPMLIAHGLPTAVYDQWNSISPEWDRFLYYRYRIHQHSPENFLKFDEWTKSFGLPVNKDHPYYDTLIKAAAYLAEFPDRVQLLLDTVKKDPSVAVRLIESGVDFTQFKEPWQMNYFLEILNDNDFSAKKIKRVYDFLLTHPMETCWSLNIVRNEAPAIFNALLKLSTNSKNCTPENLTWMINFAEECKDIEDFSLLFGHLLHYKETPLCPDMNTLITEMKKHPTPELRKTLRIFARNPQVLYMHLTKSAAAETEALEDFYYKSADRNPTMTQRLIDGACRLMAINEREILSSVLQLIIQGEYALALNLINFTFTGRRDISKEIPDLRKTKNHFNEILLINAKVNPKGVIDLFELRNNDKFKEACEVFFEDKWPSFASGFRKLDENRQNLIYEIISKNDRTLGEINLLRIIRDGNSRLFAKLTQSTELSIDTFSDFDFYNPNIVRIVEQICDIHELLKFKQNEGKFKAILNFCLDLVKINSRRYENTIIILSKLICLIDSEPELIDISLPTSEYLKVINVKYVDVATKTFSDLLSFVKLKNKSTPKYATQAETLFCDAIARLLVLSNNTLNHGLSEMLSSGHFDFFYSDTKGLYSEHFLNALSLLANDDNIQSVITSIRFNPHNTQMNDLIRKCLKIDPAKPLTSTDCQKLAVSAMLFRLKQDDFGSCFVTNVSIQVQNTQPLLEASDLKAIIENGTITRTINGKAVFYPLVYPDYIFSEGDHRKQQGLVQMWDLSNANMAGAEERMLARIRKPMRHFITKSLRKTDTEISDDLCDKIIRRLMVNLNYVYEPKGSGIFNLHWYDTEKYEWQMLKTPLGFRLMVKNTLTQLMKEEDNALVKKHLEHLYKDVFSTPAFEKKLQEYITVSSPGASASRLVSKQSKMNIINFGGGYGASVLRSYFETHNLYEESFTAHTVEELYSNLTKLRDSFPPDAVVSFFTLGHVSSFVKSLNKTPTDINKMKENGERLLMTSLIQCKPLYENALKAVFKDTIASKIEKQISQLKDSMTLKEFFALVPGIIESVTGSTADVERFLLNMDTRLLTDPGLANLRGPFDHLIYTNWYRYPVLDPYTRLISDQHWGFGFRPSSGGLGIYKISEDEVEIIPQSLKDIFKTYKIRFVVK